MDLASASEATEFVSFRVTSTKNSKIGICSFHTIDVQHFGKNMWYNKISLLVVPTGKALVKINRRLVNRK